MRRELAIAAALGLGACFVGGPDGDALEAETVGVGDDELGCTGCPCDEQTPCEPGLECAEVCLPPAMALVPAGPFLRGCEDDTCELEEAPQRMIELSAFAIDIHEVTVADYLACVTARPDPCPLPIQTWDAPDSPYNFGAPDRDEHPINGVTWEQAAAYCERLDKRLPTEAEWEKAARGVTGERYPWGSAAPTCERANLAIGGPGCGSGATIETGQLAGGASSYGILDMAGNVAEWVADYYQPYYYANSPTVDPPGPDAGSARCVRGGGWLSPISQARTSARGFAVEASPQIGFRCARSIP